MLTPPSREELPAPNPAEFTLRPATLEEFVGQEKIKRRLDVMIASARQRGDALEHLLFSGPPGLGKTSLAHILAQTMGVHLRITSGPALEKAGDLAGLLTALQPHDVLFIDEIHRLSKTIEEYLYPALEDYRLDIVIDQGPNARSVTLHLPKFTLIGATTRPGLLSAPLRSRFGILQRLDYYGTPDLTRIVLRSSGLLGVEIDDAAAAELASRSRGTPRIANNLLRWVRDYAVVHHGGKANAKAARDALALLEIDSHGLDDMDKRILETLILKFQGGPVGVQSLAVALGEDPDTLEDVHEPFLIMEGYLQRTPQGRIALPRAHQHLGLPPKPSQPGLL